MVILGSEEILKLIRNKPPLIENVEERNIQPAGVDLRVKCIYKLKNGGFIGIKDRKTPEVERIHEKIGEKYILQPNEFVLVETIEKVNMPQDLVAIVLPRTSLFRCGVTLFTGVVDPGFQGTLTFGMKNMSDFPFEIEIGSRIAQIVFKKVIGNERLYDGKYQGGKIV